MSTPAITLKLLLICIPPGNINVKLWTKNETRQLVTKCTTVGCPFSVECWTECLMSPHRSHLCCKCCLVWIWQMILQAAALVNLSCCLTVSDLPHCWTSLHPTQTRSFFCWQWLICAKHGIKFLPNRKTGPQHLLYSSDHLFEQPVSMCTPPEEKNYYTLQSNNYWKSIRRKLLLLHCSTNLHAWVHGSISLDIFEWEWPQA